LPHVSQQLRGDESDSQTISQDSDGDPVSYLKKNEENAYLDAITDSQVMGGRSDAVDKYEIEQREGILIDTDMLQDQQSQHDSADERPSVNVGLVEKTEQDEEEEEQESF
jgi:hypothetical protein